MARWFDETAKSAARRDVAGTQHEGMTRRTVITRGAVVAGVAWTAPMLMQTRAYAGMSMCPAPGVYCAGTSGIPQCCPVGTLCNIDLVTGVPTCAAVGTPGGTCGNQGNGNGGCTLAKCNGNDNQCNGCAKPNICGGESAYCGTGGDVCASGLECTAFGSVAGKKHCRRVCTVDSDCNTAQICDSNKFCAEVCGTVTPSTTSTCQGGGTCAQDGTTNNKTCSYVQSA